MVGHSHVRPTINSDEHGARILLASTITLAIMLMMFLVAIYNRVVSSSYRFWDGIVLVGAVLLDIVFFVMCRHGVAEGIGGHTRVLGDEQLLYLKKMTLGSLIVLYLSHGIVAIAYNLLARRTARDRLFQSNMDALSGIVGLWTVANVAVMGYYLVKVTSPNRIFFWVSGAVSITIILVQLIAFVRILSRTGAERPVKIMLSLLTGFFVPFAVVPIIYRLVKTPVDYFAGDWTFDLVPQILCFAVELNVVTMVVLAPSLPFFFHKTSTRGVYWLPGEVDKPNTDSELPNSHTSAYYRKKEQLEAGNLYNSHPELFTQKSSPPSSLGRRPSDLYSLDRPSFRSLDPNCRWMSSPHEEDILRYNHPEPHDDAEIHFLDVGQRSSDQWSLVEPQYPSELLRYRRPVQHDEEAVPLTRFPYPSDDEDEEYEMEESPTQRTPSRETYVYGNPVRQVTDPRGESPRPKRRCYSSRDIGTAL